MERTSSLIEVDCSGVRPANTTRALKILETSHPPVYYIPPEDVRTDGGWVTSRVTGPFKGEPGSWGW